MYSAAWVRSQSRMSSTSNQETWRADVDGRVVVDLLRHALTACALATFTLADCVQSLLGQTLEAREAGSACECLGRARMRTGVPCRVAACLLGLSSCWCLSLRGQASQS